MSRALATIRLLSGSGRNLQTRPHVRASAVPQRSTASASGVQAAIRLVQHQARQQGEGRAGALAGLHDHPLGRLARSRPEREDGDASLRQRRQCLGSAGRRAGWR